MVSKTQNRNKYIVQTVLIGLILIMVNLLAKRYNSFLDLTEDQSFTLTQSTEELLSDVDDVILIEVLLAGDDLPSGFKRLQERTEEVLKQFKSLNAEIQYNFRNPIEGNIEDIKREQEILANEGVTPTNLIVMENDQRVEKLIYPFALVQYGPRKIPVNLLEPQGQGESEEVALNRSSSVLEYKIASGINKLFKKQVPYVVFTEGNGELLESQTAMLETTLKKTIETGRVNLDSTYKIEDRADLLIVAGPTQPISQRSQFLIDQYIMNGGKVIWLIDQYFVNLDSINRTRYVPKPTEIGLENMFFKYGIRMNEDLVLDLQNDRIPQVIGNQGGQPQQELFPWVYHPLLQSSNKHVITKNIDRVVSKFPSSISLLDTKLDLEQTVLLNSSRYSRFQLYPMTISFDIVMVEQRPEKYNKPFLPTAVLVEGTFESFFKNRVPDAFKSTLENIGSEFKESSPTTSQIFVTDSDIIKNLFNPASSQISPMGFNKWTGDVYNGNSDFILNAVDYMLDDYGLMESRSKELKLRMLDQVKLQSQRLKWQLINVVLPIIIVLLFGWGYQIYRRRKYV